MRLVNDDGVKPVLREALQALFAHHGLHGADHHAVPAAQRRILGLFHSAAQTRCLMEFVRRLFEQFAAVREYQHAFARAHAVLDDAGKDDGLACAGGQHQQCPAVAVLPLGQDGLFCFCLIRS